MVFKVYSSGEHIENINGVNVKDQKYHFAVNPNNEYDILNDISITEINQIKFDINTSAVRELIKFK